MTDQPTLKRGLGLPLLTLYGLGTTVGAGIFVLVGKVAEIAGPAAPLAFLIAAGLAGLTALTFGEMAARYPVSASEAAYVEAGLRSRRLATGVGFLVVAAATVSSAAIVNGFVGYFRSFVEIPDWSAIILMTVALAALAAWGIVESVTVAAIVTVIEVGGLVLVIAVAGDSLVGVPEWADSLADLEIHALALPVLTAAVLAFYAFIGFEDMVNLSEEVRDVRHTMRRAILITLGVTALLYFSVSTVSILTVSPAELGASDAPLALIYERATGSNPYIISAIGIVAVVNGALIQIIMASRVLYGLSSRGMLIRALARVNAKTQTPIRATLLVAGLVLILALLLPIVTLAQATSLIALTIFALVNLSLVQIRRRETTPAVENPIPLWIPVLGFLVSAAFTVFQAKVLIFS